MKYSIPQDSESVFDVLVYTVKAMNEVGLMPGEIEDFLSDAISDSNWHLIEVSNAQLEDCNRLDGELNGTNGDWFEDTWRDHYYDSLWDSEDDVEDGDKDTYDYLTTPHSTRRYYWEDDIVDDEEAYEGFSSCRKHHWDCSGEDLDTLAINDYYDNMRHEDDPSYDEFDPNRI